MTTQHIVVGVDGSEGGRAALAWAGQEAQLRSADLEVVLVWSYPYYVDPVGGAFALPGIVESTEAQERALLDAEILEVLGETPAFTVQRTARCGSTSRELLDAAQGADLLVVGSRGRGGFRSMLLGSTSMQCVHHAPCPVVVVPFHPADHGSGGASGAVADGG